MTRTAIALVIVWAAVSARPELAEADRSSRSRADRRLAKGLELYRARDYDKAIAMFKEGYAIEPRREFLYALGQAERLSGDCESALVYYRNFLSRNPPEKAAAAAFEQIEVCERALASGPARRSRPAPAPPPPVVVAPAPRASPPAPPWYHDTVGDALLGAGVVFLVAGGGFFASAQSSASAAGSAEDYPEFDRLAGLAHSRRNVAIGMTVAGSALVGAAVYRFVWGGDRGRHIEATPAAGGGVVSFGGRF